MFVLKLLLPKADRYRKRIVNAVELRTSHLGTGVILLLFHSGGNCPDLRLKLNKETKLSAIAGAVNLSISPLI